MWSKEEQRKLRPVTLMKALLMGYQWDNRKGYTFEIIEGPNGHELVIVATKETGPLKGEKTWLPYPLPLSIFLKQAMDMDDRDYADVCMFITKNTKRGR